MDRTQPFEVPSGRVARGNVVAPPSKSHAIRALVCAALADGTSTLRGLSRCEAEDVVHTVGALRTLGFAIDGDRVTGAGGRVPTSDMTLDLGGSGTALRFLAAVAALGSGPTTLTGDASLRGRPMLETIRTTGTLGAHCRSSAIGRDATPPLIVTPTHEPPNAPRSEHVWSAVSESSQSLSAALTVGPLVREGWELHVTGEIVSRPYVELTLWTLQQFGVSFSVVPTNERAGPGLPSHATSFRHVGGRHRSVDIAIVGDWSSAAFPMAAAAVSGIVEVHGLEFDSPQADRKIVEILQEFGATVQRLPDGVRVVTGARRELDVDLRDAPDLAPLVGALGCVAPGTTRVRGAAHLRHKESDRIATVVAAAKALGCGARELPDGFEIDGPAKHGGVVETKGDHRIAMAFAVAGLAVPGVVIDDPACVAKSYPAFWDDFARLIGGGPTS